MSIYKIYGSSAGSGKTFTLTKTFLRLLLQTDESHYFKHILAITFTNDAAAEMKERILQTLKELSGEEEKLSGKSKAVLEALKPELNGLEYREIRQRATAAFDRILEDYSDFNVKTIDSFVNQLVTSFSLDLGLPYNYEVILDKEPILLKAAERVFDKIGTDGHDHISELVQNFAEEQADEGKNWQNLLPNLAQFASNLFDDQYYNLIQKNEGLDYADYLKIKKQIDQHIAIIKNTYLQFGKKGKALLEENGLSVDDFSYGKGGFASIFLKLEDPENDMLNKEWDPGKRIIEAIEKDVWYTKKTPVSTQNAIDNINGDLKSFYFEVMDFLDTEKPKYMLCKEVRKNLDNLALLDEVKSEFYKILHENDQAYITDFNRRINKVIASEPIPYIFERLGERYNHILIDEFQDTSDIQYYNLLPLIENALSKNQFNMLVGDPKQSIYRWRGGKVELMIHLLNKNTEALKENPLLSLHQHFTVDFTSDFLSNEHLDKNYRSKKEIIEFNRDFFKRIAESSDESMVKSAFENAAQDTHAGTKDGGHVELCINENDKTDDLEWNKSKILSTITEVLSQGYGLGDIAILCRNKKNAAAPIAEFLISEGYPVISADSLLLKNYLGVNFLISLLMAYQDDARSDEAILLYHRYKALKFPDKLNQTNIWMFLKTQDIDIDLHILSAFGLFQLTESIANKVGLFEDVAGLPYLFALFDLVQNYVKNMGNSLADFLDYWHQSGKMTSVSIAKPDAITVSTVHKSKGLEYPIVIVPFANWSVVPQNNSKAWYDLSQFKYPEFSVGDKQICASPITFKKDLKLTPVADQYQQELEFSKLEALNILYVAFTRPVDRLYILSKKPARGESNTIYTILTSFLGPYQLDDNQEYTRTFYQGLNNKTVKEKVLEPTYALETIHSNENLGKLRIKSSVDKLFNEQNQRDKGNLIHTLFSEIVMATDLEQALRKLQLDGLINETEKVELKKDAAELMNHPALHPHFHGDIQVENERDILVKNEDFSRPDRVVIKNNSVTVIDYKTGQKRKAHEYQIKHYGELYRNMGYDQVELLLVYLNPTEVVPIRF